MRAVVFLLLLCGIADPGRAADARHEDGRARIDYMLNCQGCHQPDGAGSPGAVPRLRDHLGGFVRVPGGREYLVRVPGAALSALDDAGLAAVLNWMLRDFSAAELPADFVPYDAAEVGRLRREPLADAESERRILLQRMEVLEERSRPEPGGDRDSPASTEHGKSY
ncbi:MAG: hypothetical protein HYY48_02740 [Gammaproteobacteria bacterium]|nr:hypothetical protein [Gammaproteobacteria bacterium]